MSSYKFVLDMVRDVDSENLKITLDAPLLAEVQEPVDEAVREVGKLMVHSHTSDFVTRPGAHIHVQEGIIRPVRLKAVPLGEGEVNLKTFVKALKETGYDGYLSYEICGPVQGGGGEENLDKYARMALEYMQKLVR